MRGEWVTDTHADGTPILVDGKQTTRPVIPPPFEADVDVCPGCEEQERFSRSLQSQAEGERPPGERVVLVPPDRSTYHRDQFTGPALIDVG